MKKTPIVWLTGLSQGGTTLLLSLMDGHPDLLTYPDEPSFRRLFERSGSYQDASHMVSDFLFGTPNPLHYSRLADIKLDHSDRTRSRVRSADRDFLKNTNRMAAQNQLRGIDASAFFKTTGFEQSDFFVEYSQELLILSKNIETVDPKALVQASFDALRHAARKTVPGLKTGYINTFKHPISRLRGDDFSWFFNSWPEGKIIFMRRNPYSRLASRITSIEKKKKHKPRLHENPLKFVKLAGKTASDHCISSKLKSSDNFLVLDYENMIMDLESEMKKAAAFIGIPFHGSLLKISKLGIESRIPTNRTGEDQKVSKMSLEKWKHILSGPETGILKFLIKLQGIRKTGQI
jgi:hypothetical protein